MIYKRLYRRFRYFLVEKKVTNLKVYFTKTKKVIKRNPWHNPRIDKSNQ